MERRPPKEDWQEVTGRRRRDSKKQWENNRRHEKQVTKFYVTNLPDSCSRDEISKAFGCYGEVVNVYIARKRDALGRLFGFVSFTNVYDGLDLQRKLGKVVIGKNKVKANIAKFAAENFDQRFAHLRKEGRGSGMETIRKEGHKVQVQAKTAGGDGFSYRDMLMNAKGDGGSNTYSKNFKVVHVNEEVMAFSECFEKAIIGKVLNFEALRNLRDLLEEGRVAGTEVAYLGGLFVLVKFENAEKTRDFCAHNEWRQWFSEVEVWKGKTFPFERIAWLKIIRVPLHLLVKEVFVDIGGIFGKVIHHVEQNSEEKDLSSGCVGVLVDNGEVISDEVKLDWKGCSFRVWVKEEVGSWIPEGMGKIVSLERDENDNFSDGSSEFSDVGNKSRSGHTSSMEEDEQSADRSVHGESTFLFGNSKGGYRDGVVGSQEGDSNKGGPVRGQKKFKRKIRISKRKVSGPVSKNNLIGKDKSASPRPNKRARQEDPFNIDFLFPENYRGRGVEENPMQGESIRSPSWDLNRTFGGAADGRNGDLSADNGGQLSSGVEIRETVAVGLKVGMNLEGFEKEVEKIIEKEGIATVES